MENLILNYNGNKKINTECCIGQQSPKQVEIKLSFPKTEVCKVTVNSDVNEDSNLWKSIMDRFFLINDIHADIEINDFGAKPSTILFKLLQAMEVSCY